MSLDPMGVSRSLVPVRMGKRDVHGFPQGTIEHGSPGCRLDDIYFKQFAASLGHGGSQLAGSGPKDPPFSHPNGHEFALAGG